MDWFFVFFICWAAFVGIMLIRTIMQSLRKSAALRQHGRQTQGVVVRNKIMWGRIIVIRPVMRFTTASGQVIEAVDHSGWASAFPRFMKGDKVVIIYNEQDPMQFERV